MEEKNHDKTQNSLTILYPKSRTDREKKIDENNDVSYHILWNNSTSSWVAEDDLDDYGCYLAEQFEKELYFDRELISLK